MIILRLERAGGVSLEAERVSSLRWQFKEEVTRDGAGRGNKGIGCGG